MATLTLRKGPSGPPVDISDTIVAPGQLLGNPITATTSEPAEPVTSDDAGAIVRFAGLLNLTLAPGTYNDVAIPDGTQTVNIDPNPNGNVLITGFAFSGRGNQGAFFTLDKFNAGGSVILMPNDPGSAVGNRISTPGGGPYEMPNAADGVFIQAITEPGQPTVFQVCDRMVPPTGITPEISGFGCDVTIAVPFVAGPGGAPDDVIILAVVPFQVRILDAALLVSSAVIGASATVRNTIGGAGAALTTVLSAAATGTVRNNDTATRATSLGLFLRRSDSAIAGTIVLTLNRV